MGQFKILSQVAIGAVLALGLLQPAQVNATEHLKISKVGYQGRLTLASRKSILVDLPTAVADVAVADPSVADAVITTTRRIMIVGMGLGETNIFLFDQNRRKIATLDISVQTDLANLRKAYRRLMPNSTISADMTGKMVTLTGKVESAKEVTQAVQIASSFVGSNSNILNLLDVMGPQQVHLKVTVAEIQRSTIKQLGVDLNSSLSIGRWQNAMAHINELGGASNTTSNGTISSALSAGGFSVQATIKAMERNGVLKTLAEPTLTALSGETASFNAGGQFPILTDEDIQFKDFGISLKFTPTVMDGGRINLKVDTEVSELTSISGVTLPGLNSRKANTVVETSSGGGIVIAGLIEDTMKQQFNELPGLGRLPILGTLFRSRDFLNRQTELVIMVTPYLVKSASPSSFDLPSDGFRVPDEFSSTFMGQMNQVYGVSQGAPKGMYHGQVGHVYE